MFFSLDIHNRTNEDEYKIHRVFPAPCIKLPEHRYQISLGDHEDYLSALNEAKKQFPANKIILCSHCCNKGRTLSPSEFVKLIS